MDERTRTSLIAAGAALLSLGAGFTSVLASLAIQKHVVSPALFWTLGAVAALGLILLGAAVFGVWFGGRLLRIECGNGPPFDTDDLTRFPTEWLHAAHRAQSPQLVQVDRAAGWRARVKLIRIRNASSRVRLKNCRVRVIEVRGIPPGYRSSDQTILGTEKEEDTFDIDPSGEERVVLSRAFHQQGGLLVVAEGGLPIGGMWPDEVDVVITAAADNSRPARRELHLRGLKNLGSPPDGDYMECGDS